MGTRNRRLLALVMWLAIALPLGAAWQLVFNASQSSVLRGVVVVGGYVVALLVAVIFRLALVPRPADAPTDADATDIDHADGQERREEVSEALSAYRLLAYGADALTAWATAQFGLGVPGPTVSTERRPQSPIPSLRDYRLGVKLDPEAHTFVIDYNKKPDARLLMYFQLPKSDVQEIRKFSDLHRYVVEYLTTGSKVLPATWNNIQA